ncbi:MAG TPA: hypothetical protein VEX15_11210 [Nocardioidaceae bacterium]|nr:hypothetical protein [Nocardioidaceae bacterium]
MTLGPAPRIVVMLAAASGLVLTACSGDDAPTASSLTIVDTHELDLPFGDAYLSPDGERIATYADSELCIYTADGDQERCTADELQLDPNSIRWSPDSSRLAFTENYFVFLTEPDIWVLDADSAEATDLTDDGVAPHEINVIADADSSDAVVDTTPTWVDDSTIRFIRRTGDDEPVAVMEISTSGGDPDEVGTLDTTTPPAAVAYGPDGTSAVYGRLGDGDLVMSDLDGGNVETLSDVPGYAVSASPAGDEVVVLPAASAWLTDDDAPPTSIHSFDGGEPMEIDGRLTWATWRNDGDGFAYAEADEMTPTSMSLRLADSPAAEAEEVGHGSYLAPYRAASFRLPVWSAQDTMLLMQLNEDGDGDASGFGYVLVQFGAE